MKRFTALTRDVGARRVSTATRWTAVTAIALSAAFSWLAARAIPGRANAAAHASRPVVVRSGESGDDSGAPAGLQPPLQAPAPAPAVPGPGSGSGVAVSGGS